MRIFFIYSFVFLLTLNIPVNGQDNISDLPDIARKARSAIYLLITYDSNGKELKSGTGFVTSNDGKMITNYHVIEGANSVIAKSESGGIYPIKGLIATDSANDLAVLEIDGHNLPALNLGSSINLEAGQQIFVIGSPLGLEGTLSDGIISAVRKISGNNLWIQITAPISHGSSGSPVFNSQGEVIGVATMNLLGGQSLNFAIGIETVKHLLANIKDKTNFQSFPVLSVESNDIENDPDYITAYRLFFTEDYVQMLVHTQALIKKYPRNALAHYTIGLAYHFLTFTSDAIDAYRVAIKIDPNLNEAWTNLGAVYFDSGRIHDSINAIQQAIKIEPNDSDAWYNLGQCYRDLEQYSDAITAYQQAIAITPNYTDALFKLGRSHDNLGHTQDSITAYQQTIKIDPNYFDAWNNLGTVYDDIGDYINAIKSLKTAIKINPNSVIPLINLGNTYNKAGRPTEAISVLKKAISINSNIAGTWINLANAYRALGDYVNALAALNKARELDPSIH